MATEQAAFLEILTFIAGALLTIGVGALVSAWLRPKQPNQEKLSTYESGEEPMGNAGGRFNARFYVLAVVFVLFEVETILLFPWATVWANQPLHEATDGLWTTYTALSGMLFILLLAVGLAYVWRLGYLTIPPPPLPPSFTSPVPKTHYEHVNDRYASSSSKPLKQPAKQAAP